jgi:hypothetical protein
MVALRLAMRQRTLTLAFACIAALWPWRGMAQSRPEEGVQILRQVGRSLGDSRQLASVSRAIGTGRIQTRIHGQMVAGTLRVVWVRPALRRPWLWIATRWKPGTYPGVVDEDQRSLKSAVMHFGESPLWGPGAELDGVEMDPEHAADVGRIRFVIDKEWLVRLVTEAQTHRPSKLFLYRRKKAGYPPDPPRDAAEWVRVEMGGYRPVDGLVLPHSYRFYFKGDLFEVWELDRISAEWTAPPKDAPKIEPQE